MAGHGKPLLRRSSRFRAMGRLGAWNEDHAIEVRAVHRRSRGRDVSDMNRIESPAKNAQPQG
jgi:hypothetical protein